MLTRDNQISIIGTIESINLIKDSSPKVGAYIRGDLVVKVSHPKQMNIPVSFFSGAVSTKDNKPRKLYGQLESLRQGQRVSLSVTVGSNKFWDTTRGQLVKTTRLNLNFINNVSATDVDRADFVFSGFVKESLRELHSKDGELKGYIIQLAQASYDGLRAEVIGFMVDENNRQAINYITNEYTAGKTVKVSGQLDYDITTETREEAQDFGSPIVKTFQKSTKNLMITSGSSVSEGVYEKEDIDKLLAADLDEDNSIQEKAKTQEKSGAVTSTNKPLASTTKTNQSLL
jgi:hypothetical protein